MSGEQLERRYRGLLRILPKPYRQAREEELLSVLMEGAGQGRRWPEPRETLSLARLGLRARLGAASDGTEVSTRTGEMVRAVGIVGSMLLAFVGVAQLAMFADGARMSGGAFWTWSDPTVVTYAGRGPQMSIFSYEVPALWLAVLALITVGWWRTARTLALGVFLVSLYLSDGTQTALQEEALLAGVVTAALFAVRGVHARRLSVPGSVAVVAVAGAGGWLYEGHQGPLMKAFLAFQAAGYTENLHALVMAAVAVAVVGVVAYRSAVWPVALAVVAVAALMPVFLQNATQSYYSDGDQIPLAFLAGGLVLVAALAVLKERRAARSERSENPAVAS